MTATLNRREVLRRVALMMGGAISAPAAMHFLSGCSAKPQLQWKPVFFSEPQAAVVTEIVQIMIPRTDTPGAAEVGVPAFIDTMLKDAYAADDQKRFLSGLAAFEELSTREHESPFLKLEPAQRAALVQSVHDAALEENLKLPRSAVRRQRPFILMTKELSLLGYFTSEVGATQVLQYQAIPGAYHGCLPLAQAGNGKTWATETSSPF